MTEPRPRRRRAASERAPSASENGRTYGDIRSQLAALLDEEQTVKLDPTRLAKRLQDLAYNDMARDLLAAEAATPIPEPVRLDRLLAEPDEGLLYRVDGLWPVDGRVLVAAQWKAGKTTLLQNLVRSLVDGEPLLGQWSVEPLPRGRTITIVDTEMTRRQTRQWYRDQSIRHTRAVNLFPIRGAVSAFNILDPVRRSEWAKLLRDLRTDVLGLDCLRPVLDACGLDENSQAGLLLDALSALAAEAGVREHMVVHHMGHSGERSRGDSRLRDWPDAEWRLMRDKDEAVEDPAAPRYFSAYGRDVDVPEMRVEYDEEMRRLVVDPQSRGRAADRRDRLMKVLVDVVAAIPGESTSKVADAAGRSNKNGEVTRVLEAAERDGLLRSEPWRNGKRWWPA